MTTIQEATGTSATPAPAAAVSEATAPSIPHEETMTCMASATIRDRLEAMVDLMQKHPDVLKMPKQNVVDCFAPQHPTSVKLFVKLPDGATLAPCVITQREFGALNIVNPSIIDMPLKMRDSTKDFMKHIQWSDLDKTYDHDYGAVERFLLVQKRSMNHLVVIAAVSSLRKMNNDAFAGATNEVYLAKTSAPTPLPNGNMRIYDVLKEAWDEAEKEQEQEQCDEKNPTPEKTK
jgi:hypothetical protein